MSVIPLTSSQHLLRGSYEELVPVEFGLNTARGTWVFAMFRMNFCRYNDNVKHNQLPVPIDLHYVQHRKLINQRLDKTGSLISNLLFLQRDAMLARYILWPCVSVTQVCVLAIQCDAHTYEQTIAAVSYTHLTLPTNREV